jgi:hypothetical protein
MSACAGLTGKRRKLEFVRFDENRPFNTVIPAPAGIFWRRGAIIGEVPPAAVKKMPTCVGMTG